MSPVPTPTRPQGSGWALLRDQDLVSTDGWRFGGLVTEEGSSHRDSLVEWPLVRAGMDKELPPLDFHSGAFSTRLEAFGTLLKELLTDLDLKRLEEHVGLAVVPPGGVGDAEHLGEPAVFSLLAYGVAGLQAISRLQAEGNSNSRWWAPEALLCCALQRPEVAQSCVSLTTRYLDQQAFRRLNERIAETCLDERTVSSAARLYEDFIRAVPTRDVGHVLMAVGIRFGEDRERISAWSLAVRARNERQMDPTGTFWSRRHLQADLEASLVSGNTPSSVAFFDMNGLKSINDSYGHQVGDQAIEQFLRVLATEVGSNENGYRGEGGDEVVLVLTCQVMEAEKRVLGLLRRLAASPVEVASKSLMLSASCGIAGAKPGEGAGALLGRADAAMYAAKAASKGPTRTSRVAVDRDRDGPQLLDITS